MAILSAVLQLVGTILEVIGAILMANQYIGTPTGYPLTALTLLVSALFGSKTSKGVALDIIPTRDNKLKSLRGLSLLGLGFVLQALSALISCLLVLK